MANTTRFIAQYGRRVAGGRAKALGPPQGARAQSEPSPSPAGGASAPGTIKAAWNSTMLAPPNKASSSPHGSVHDSGCAGDAQKHSSPHGAATFGCEDPLPARHHVLMCALFGERLRSRRGCSAGDGACVGSVWGSGEIFNFPNAWRRG